MICVCVCVCLLSNNEEDNKEEEEEDDKEEEKEDDKENNRKWIHNTKLQSINHFAIVALLVLAYGAVIIGLVYYCYQDSHITWHTFSVMLCVCMYVFMYVHVIIHESTHHVVSFR